jgi:hypothetical protein
LTRAAPQEEIAMHVRDTWLLEEDTSLDEPSDWAITPEMRPLPREDSDDDRGFRSLLDDAEACRHWGRSGR